MKSKVQSFSFLMELIIVILFFAASTTVCASFIVQAKNKQVQGTNLQNVLIEAQSMIETMQAYPLADLEQLLEVEKIDENHYQKDNIFIEIDRDMITQGKIMIKNKNEVISELPFVLGGNHDE